MMESPELGPDERSFAASLRRGVKELRDQRGTCPGAEELVAFREGRLNAQDSARVREHVEACGLCDLVLGRLEVADISRTPSSTHRWGWISGRLWHPILAYGLVALLLYPAYLGVRQRLDPKPPSNALPPAISIPSFSLDAPRGIGTGAQAHVVHLTDRDKSFALVFFVPMQADRHYFAEIKDRSGRVAVTQRVPIAGDPAGRVALVCRRDAFVAGEYTVTVAETDPAGSRFEYVFQIE